MSGTFPGTTIEVSKFQKGSSQILFDGIFAAGGITLSQISVMTGLEPYIIQNWVKRGFVTSPKKRLYSRGQFARIVIINMLRECLKLEQICELIRVIGGVLEDPDDDLISDDELYHRYVNMLADTEGLPKDDKAVEEAARRASEGFSSSLPNSNASLVRILQVMFYAHTAAQLRAAAEQIFSTLK